MSSRIGNSEFIKANVLKQDALSPELRLAEIEIDNHYSSNPLMKGFFATSVWHFLAYCEDTILIPLLRRDYSLSIHESAAVADFLVNNLNYPIRWLFNKCASGGSIPFSFDGESYQSAHDLYKLSENYRPFVAAFTYASGKIISLELQDKKIVPSTELHDDSKYEMYDRLIDSSTQIIQRELLKSRSEDLLAFLAKYVVVSTDRFSYKMNPKIVKEVEALTSPILDPRYKLPDEWRFSKYSMVEFKEVSKSLFSMMFIHSVSRIIAASQGCKALGYCDSIYITNADDLHRQLARYSNVSTDQVIHICGDLIYGSNGIYEPDPAIQPLIKFNKDQYAIMPSLIINSSMERNLTILLNRLPDEKDIYSRLVSQKESLMRDKIKDVCSHLNLRFFHGKIPSAPNLPDIDLAVINDREKICLLLELKWFIAPAEAREIIEKSEEIQKGIHQLEAIYKSFKNNPEVLFNILKLDDEYEICLAVVSESSVGLKNVQSPDIPVIRLQHLIKSIEHNINFKRIIHWLHDRGFLPITGKHYEIRDFNYTIGKYDLSWYGLKTLIEGDYAMASFPPE